MAQRKYGCRRYFCYRPTPLTVCNSEARRSLQRSRSLLLSGASPGPRLRDLSESNSISVSIEFGLGGGESLPLVHLGLDPAWESVKETRPGGPGGNCTIQCSLLYVPTCRYRHSYNSKQSCDKPTARSSVRIWCDASFVLCSHESPVS